MLSLTTIAILAWAKIFGFAFIFFGLYFIWRKKSVTYWLYLTAAVVILFYWVLAKDLQTMFWGNVGDEMFILAYLSKVLLGNFGHDFYYDWLPQFYPPLYFWLTGILAKPIAVNAIGAAKIGILGTLFIWLVGAFYYQKFWWEKIYRYKFKFDSILEKAWFWYLYPVIYFVSLDFDAIILKPYEAVSALFGILLLVFFARAIWQANWPKKYYLFFGISAGLVFLTFYFWFVIFIPVALALIYFSKNKKDNFKRLAIISSIALAPALLFVGPLLWSYLKYGLDTAQATHFVAGDFFSFLAWQNFSLKALLSLLGLTGIFLFYKKSAIKSAALVLIFSFAYQIINFILFISGFKPIQASKPFYFLATAALSLSASYLLIYVYQKYLSKVSKRYLMTILSVSFILLSGLLPHFSFIDQPEILQQIEKDLRPANEAVLSQDLKNVVADYQSRTWLSTGPAALNAYIPMSYYLANAVHFSHHSALFTRRWQELEDLTQASSSFEFMKLIDQGEPRKIDSLLFYNDTSNAEHYVFDFWVDNYPNGGRNQKIYLAKDLISEEDWNLVYNKNNWLIFLRK
ncbi:hypothetical protein KBC40_01485 [Patescibacteria group bacterium]|nr:hypothetical protein [Patescibacteria group bacterium]